VPIDPGHRMTKPIEPGTTQDAQGARTLVSAMLIVHLPEPLVFALTENESVVIGRSEPADVVVPDASVSRAHARATWEDGMLTIEDLESRNGTWVRGQRILGKRKLIPNEPFQLGSITASLNLTVHVDGLIARSTLPYARFVARLDDEVHRARTLKQSLSVLVVSPLRGELPLADWLRTVRACIRTDDPVTAYSDRALMVMLPGMDSSAAQETARAIVERKTRLAVGVASLPPILTSQALIENAWEAHRSANRNDPVRIAAPTASAALAAPRDLVAETPVMRELVALARRLASLPSAVLIQGETGTGKEAIARLLHDEGPRARGPFVAINCGAIPATLLEDAFFGHERGAFSGADDSRAGAFERAQGGTLFLDEVGDLDLRAQAALLRAIEQRTIMRIGGAEEIAIDARFVSATHRDLARMVEAGSFRRDLYYRLSAISLAVPPLRSRREDIDKLIDVILRDACVRCGVPEAGIEEDARRALIAQDWPGNVRELRNVIERAVVLCAPMPIRLADLKDQVGTPSSAPEPPASEPGQVDLKKLLREYEERILEDALRQAGGNQTQAAKALRMPLRTFVYKLKQLGITKQPKGK
jgi:two-component system, NtrC family, response regulator AtoC